MTSPPQHNTTKATNPKSKVSSLISYILYLTSKPYHLLLNIRNKAYDWGIFKSEQSAIPSIVVGNLTLGGTGKTPHIEYFIRLYQKQYQIATLSRGYKRKTTGYHLATAESTAADIGDEPYQLKQKFPEITVAVGEKRVAAIQQLAKDRPETQLVLLDDAFQHRALKADVYLLLTDYHRLFTRDALVPAGRLREPKSGYRRADVIIVTKCPTTLSTSEKQNIIQEIQPFPKQKILFSYLKYGNPYAFTRKRNIFVWKQEMDVLLLCGIANPNPLTNYLEQKVTTVYPCFFPDHHTFSKKDLETITQQFQQISNQQKVIITTEKDAARLQKHQQYFNKQQLPIYCLPIEVVFLEEEEVNLKSFLNLKLNFN